MLNIDLISKMLDSQDIQSFVMDSSFRNISMMDYSLRQSVFSTGYTALINFIKRQCDDSNIYLIEDCFHVWNIVVPFFTYSKKEYYAAGPFVFDSSKNIFSSIDSILDGIKHKEILKLTLKDFMAKVPFVHDREHFISLIITLYNYAFKEDMQIKYCTFDDSNILISRINYKGEEKSSDADIYEMRFNTENALLYEVKQGNMEKALGFLNELVALQSDLFNPLREQKNMTVALNALLRKTVEEAGVYPYLISSVYKKYEADIERAISINQTESLGRRMISEYCLLVQNNSLERYSPAIKKAVSYIDANLDKAVSLRILSEYISLNESYLSTLFKNETGQTVISYINQKRILRAKELLMTTDMSVEEVATVCGFEDSNYFSRVFRRLESVSPSEYKKNSISIYKDNFLIN